MLDPQLFERNMLAVASRHGPLCADRVRFAVSDSRVGVMASLNGLPVTYIEEGGHRAFMH